MPKVKRDFATELEPKLAMQASSSADRSQSQSAMEPLKKKQKTPLNFSIESIMQQSPAVDSSSQAASNQQKLFSQAFMTRLSPQFKLRSPSLSPSSSNSQGSRGSSPAPSVGSVAEQHRQQLELGGSRLVCRSPPTSISGDSCASSAAQSRASTPISPGFVHSPAQSGASHISNPSFSADPASLAINNFQQLMNKQRTSLSNTSPQSTTSNSTQNQQRHHSHHHHHNHNHQSHHHHQASMRKDKRVSHPSAGSAPTGLKQSQASTSSSGGDSRLSQVECQLDNKDMWDKFHSLNTEMIITKTGRRMFPVMKVQFHNLDQNARYAVSMDIVPVDNKRYRYAYHKSCWQVAGKADPSAEPRLYPHPDSPFNGDLLSRQVISFEKVKLTNNEMDKSGHIILNSMHKYQPRVHLIELKVPPTQQTTSKSSTSSIDHHHQHNNHSHQQQQQPQLDIEGYRTFVFPETVFTAVTAYQNQLITKMKIDKNPFAKGFRDSSRLSDLDRNDPFDYMGSLGPSGRFVGQPGAPGSMEAAAAAGAHMDAYQLLASAANNPWYSAAAVAAATGGGNPFNPMGACSTAQAAQLQATQMWLAAFSACLNGGPAPPGQPGPPINSTNMLPMSGPSPHMPDQALNENGPDSSGGSSSSSANSSGTST